MQRGSAIAGSTRDVVGGSMVAADALRIIDADGPVAISPAAWPMLGFREDYTEAELGRELNGIPVLHWMFGDGTGDPLESNRQRGGDSRMLYADNSEPQVSVRQDARSPSDVSMWTSSSARMGGYWRVEWRGPILRERWCDYERRGLRSMRGSPWLEWACVSVRAFI
jgi:hypothetical protein